MPDAPTLKRYHAGTHRLCDPAETYERFRWLHPALGITRVADVTRLDRLGIPTYQAFRPNSWSLSVSHGKGITRIAAKVSAVMESAELWHAERLPPASRVSRLVDIEAELGYDVFDLRHVERSMLNRGMRLEWLDAQRMDGSGETFIPRACASMDSRVAHRWTPPVFLASSNGLASGNAVEEAALHALFELLERDGTARASALPSDAWRRVDVETIDAPEARDLLERIDAAGMEVRIFDQRGPTMIPSFAATIWSLDHPQQSGGFGCHLDSTVALCRALTEAAQSRLLWITGSRDDITADRRNATAPRRRAAPDPGRLVSFHDIMSSSTDNIERDLSLVIDKVKSQTGTSPIVVDLTRPDFGMPVVKVVAPGLALSLRRSERSCA